MYLQYKQFSKLFILLSIVLFISSCQSVQNEILMRQVVREAQFDFRSIEIKSVTFSSGFTFSIDQLSNNNIDVKKLVGEFISSGFNPKIKQIDFAIDMNVTNPNEQIDMLIDPFKLDGLVNNRKLLVINNDESIAVPKNSNKDSIFDVSLVLDETELDEIINFLSFVQNDTYTLGIQGEVYAKGNLAGVSLPETPIQVEQSVEISNNELNDIVSIVSDNTPAFLLPEEWK